MTKNRLLSNSASPGPRAIKRHSRLLELAGMATVTLDALPLAHSAESHPRS